MSSYVAALRQYATFTGRTRRRDFWLFTLVDTLLGTALFGAALAAEVVLDDGPAAVPGALQALSVAYQLATLLPALAVKVRRLHDVARSGWFYLIVLIPLIGGMLLLVDFSLDGTPGHNAYGERPS